MRVIGCRNGALGRIGPLGPTWSRGRLTWPRGYGTANTTRARPQGRAHRLRYRPVLIGTGKSQRPTEPDLRHEVQTFIRL